ncbi:MAG: hypothetical protein ACFFAO_17245 [Candidatus Hermodarchaeota archaeon]
MIKAKTTKLYNMLPLSIFFLFSAIQPILSLMTLPSIFFQIIHYIPAICLLIFVKLTFYRDKKSPFKLFMFIVITLKIVSLLIGIFIAPFTFPMLSTVSKKEIIYFLIYKLIACVNLTISYSWLAYSALKYHQTIKHQSIEPWIKRRYQIIGFSALILLIEAVAILFWPNSAEGLRDPQALLIGFIMTLETVIFSIGSIIGWMMPKKLKNYFNKDFTYGIEEPLDEDKLLEKIKSELSKEN